MLIFFVLFVTIHHHSHQKWTSSFEWITFKFFFLTCMKCYIVFLCIQMMMMMCWWYEKFRWTNWMRENKTEKKIVKIQHLQISWKCVCVSTFLFCFVLFFQTSMFTIFNHCRLLLFIGFGMAKDWKKKCSNRSYMVDNRFWEKKINNNNNNLNVTSNLLSMNDIFRFFPIHWICLPDEEIISIEGSAKRKNTAIKIIKINQVKTMRKKMFNFFF